MRTGTIGRAGAAAVLTAILAFGACSSDTKQTNDATATSAPSKGDTVATTPPPSPTYTGEGSAAACALWGDLSARFGSVDASKLDVAQRKAAFEEVAAGLDELEALAPAEIAPEVAVVNATIDQLLPLLAAVDYDINRLDTNGQKVLTDPAFSTATFNINAYVTQVCVDAPTTSPAG